MPEAATVMNGLLACEYFDITSNFVSDTFRIFVARPALAPPGRHPALLVADGNSAFTLVTSIQRTLSLGSDVPAAYVVGIGYPTENGFVQAIQKRNRDYSPTDGGEYARVILGSNVAPGAGRFLSFLTDELLPALGVRYSIDTHATTFIGYSLAALFGTWTLLTAPQTFRRYILGSPALFWNNEEVWSWEEACARTHADIQAKVYFAAGSLETALHTRQNALNLSNNGPELLRNRARATLEWCDQHGWPGLAELLPVVTDRLRSRRYAGLEIHSECLPDETHLSAPPMVISRGLRYVFRSAQPDVIV